MEKNLHVKSAKMFPLYQCLGVKNHPMFYCYWTLERLDRCSPMHTGLVIQALFTSMQTDIKPLCTWPFCASYLWHSSVKVFELKYSRQPDFILLEQGVCNFLERLIALCTKSMPSDMLVLHHAVNRIGLFLFSCRVWCIYYVRTTP